MDIEHICITYDYEVINLMTPELLKWLKDMLTDGDIKQLYWKKVWKKLRKVIIDYDHEECQVCKSHGDHTKATMVHHIKYLEYYLELGLSTTYMGIDGKTYRQLISLCDDCHKLIHLSPAIESKKVVTEERW